MAKNNPSEYVKLMENYKIARRSGREKDAKALFLKMRKLAKEKKVSPTDFDIGGYM